MHHSLGTALTEQQLQDMAAAKALTADYARALDTLLGGDSPEKKHVMHMLVAVGLAINVALSHKGPMESP